MQKGLIEEFGGMYGIRDKNLLESVVNIPKFYSIVYPLPSIKELNPPMPTFAINTKVNNRDPKVTQSDVPDINLSMTPALLLRVAFFIE